MLAADPLSLKVTHHQQQTGCNLNLNDCLKMDMRISFRIMMDEPNFKEGNSCF